MLIDEIRNLNLGSAIQSSLNQNINSQQNDTCESCKGIVCGCGSCFCEWEEPSFLYQ